MTDDIEKRLVDLEIRYTHQEELLIQLNDVVSKQALLIDRLKNELKDIKVNSTQSQEGVSNERPPHY